jgi:hypothetical protein
MKLAQSLLAVYKNPTIGFMSDKRTFFLLKKENSYCWFSYGDTVVSKYGFKKIYIYEREPLFLSSF